MAHIERRSPAQVEEIQDREAECWRRYVKGQSCREIGRALGMSHTWANFTVNRLLRERDEQLRQSVRGHVEKLIDEVNLVREAAWDGFDRSQRDRVRTVEKSGGSDKGTYDESSTTTEGQAGSPAFLRVLLECNKRESALRGIEKPTQILFQFMQTNIDIDTLIHQVETEAAKEAAVPVDVSVLDVTPEALP